MQTFNSKFYDVLSNFIVYEYDRVGTVQSFKEVKTVTNRISPSLMNFNQKNYLVYLKITDQ